MTDVVSGEVVEHRTPDEWAAVIRADLGRSVDGVVSASRHLNEARESIPSGQWLAWVDQTLGLHRSYVFKLMAVGQHQVLGDVSYTKHLPASPETLYHLSRLEAPVLRRAIEAGDVHPHLQQKQARQLVTAYGISGASKPTTAVPTVDGMVGTIVADPPWRYGNTSTRGAAEDHYPTMSIEEIAALDVPHEHAGDQAHLYLWTTAGHLPEAFTVMRAWGFEYKTYLVWVKPQMGMGNYFRVSTELVLFGIKGGLGTNTRDTMNYFTARRGKHSKKPLGFYDLVRKSSPGPYLEMFSRCRADSQLICECSKCRLGWQVWGNES